MTSRDDLLKQSAQNDAIQQAQVDEADWITLRKIIAFDRCFMRRIQEKKTALERSTIEGVESNIYPILVAQIKLLKEIIEMPVVEKMVCVRMLRPETADAEQTDPTVNASAP